MFHSKPHRAAIWRKSFLAGIFSAAAFALHCSAAVIVYEASDSTGNFIPDGPDTTPNRPTGSHIGNTVTLDGSDRLLTSLTIQIATSDISIPAQTVSVTLYENDGAADPGASGFLQPDTVIGTASVSGVTFDSNASASVTFTFPMTQVPNTFTFILDFSPGSAAQILVGAKSNNSSAQTGVGLNTLWYGTGASGSWLTDSTWAIADGATNNLIDARFLAVPEPSSTLLTTLGAFVFATGCRMARRRLS